MGKGKKNNAGRVAHRNGRASSAARVADASSVPAGRSRGKTGGSERATRDPEENEPFPRHAHVNDAERAARMPELRAYFGLVRDGTSSAQSVVVDVKPGTMSGARGGSGSGSTGLDAQALAALRPHVVNLVQGRLSDRGTFTSTTGDVDAIFDEHLPRWLSSATQSPRIVLFAHGGLVPERSGLEVAHRQHAWWLANGVYPIHFVWETGFMETLGQLISGSSRAMSRGARDLADWTSDPVVEMLARHTGGRTIWGGMKRSAERAFDEEGGGRYVLLRLRDALRRAGSAVRVNLAGHSAGSIFMGHLIDAAAKLGGFSFPTVSLLAPAITIDDFRRLYMRHSASAFDHLAIFTMKRDVERADQCGHVYRKSLLYLLRNALETENPTEILGLEESLRRTPDVAAFLGLSGAGASRPGAVREVVWSPTEGVSDGASASHATTHGGFDEDAPTMNGVLRRVLGLTSEPIRAPFPAAAQGRSFAGAGDDVRSRILSELDVQGIDPGSLRRAAGVPWSGVDSADEEEVYDDFDADERDGSSGPGAKPSPYARTGSSSGRRLALCIGIDEYPDAPLYGCVADARKWHECFRQLGFELRPLILNGDATREAILGSMRELFRGAAPGDVIAVQYSGHGSQVEDVDGDENDGGALPGDEPGKDEAMVPFDYGSGAYVIDDDLAELFREVTPGVNVTCFFDCCHSGTMNRLWPSRVGTGSGDSRARFMRLRPEQQAAHVEFRRKAAQTRGGPNRAARGARGVHAAAEIFFSACRANEVAWESGGQGDFTKRAIRILTSGIDGLTHAEFLRRVVEAFGAQRRQTPELHCADDRQGLHLLVGSSRDAADGGGAAGEILPYAERAAMATSLVEIANRLA